MAIHLDNTLYKFQSKITTTTPPPFGCPRWQAFGKRGELLLNYLGFLAKKAKNKLFGHGDDTPDCSDHLHKRCIKSTSHRSPALSSHITTTSSRKASKLPAPKLFSIYNKSQSSTRQIIQHGANLNIRNYKSRLNSHRKPHPHALSPQPHSPIPRQHNRIQASFLTVRA